MNQLTLPLAVDQQRTFANYVAGANGPLLDQLMQAGTGLATLWLWGELGAGKSHLAQATCQWHLDRGARVAYVPLSAAPSEPEILQGLAAHDLVVLDDLPKWLGHNHLELALMGLHEGLAASRGRLMATADRPAAACAFALSDLASRLCASACAQVTPLDDHGKGLVLASRAKQRGLELTPAVTEFWLARSERRLSRLLDDFERLDRVALSEQRRLTVPLLKKVLDY